MSDPSSSVSPLVAALNAASERYRDPLATLPWERLSLERYWLPRGLLSLAGVEDFDRLPEAVHLRLSHHEFLHYARVGLWLEGVFMARLSRELAALYPGPDYALRLHGLREEAGHGVMFLHLSAVSGVEFPKEWRPPRLLDWLGRHLPGAGVLFRLAVVLGEALPDAVNRSVVAENRVDELIVSLVKLHRRDEARHLAAAWEKLAEALAGASPRARWVVSCLASLLLKAFTDALFLPPAAVYGAAGLHPGAWWRAQAANNPERLARVRAWVSPTLALLAEHGVKLELPRP